MPPADLPSPSASAERPAPLTPVRDVAIHVLGERPTSSNAGGGWAGKLGRYLGRSGSDAPAAVSVDRPRFGGPPLPVELLPFLGIARPAGWIPWLRLSKLHLPDNPQQTVKRLKKARARQAAAAPAGLSAWTRGAALRTAGLRAWLLEDLTRCYPDQADELLSAAGTHHYALQGALTDIPQELQAIRRAAAGSYETSMALRIHAALTVLLSPTIRAQVPEAPQLRSRAHRLVELTRRLAPLVDAAEQFDRRRERMDHLETIAARLADAGPLDKLIETETRYLAAAAARLVRAAGNLALPAQDWFSEGPPLAVTPAAEGGPPATDDPLVLDRLQDLNLGVLTQLIGLTERVENGLNMRLLPRAAA